MKNIIMKLEGINYTDINQAADYKERAYKILDGLTNKELLEILEIENIWVRNKSNRDNVIEEIYYGLVGFKNDRRLLGLMAAKSYWE